VARDGKEMRRHLQEILHDESLALALAAHGLETIRSRHTCAHRVEQLLAIDASLRKSTGIPEPQETC
jgi:spore maturation protein CgeB